jgi:hypothetical protein
MPDIIPSLASLNQGQRIEKVKASSLSQLVPRTYSSVSGLVFDSTRGLLNFTVSGPSGTYGFFNATIARTLLSGQPVVLIDGVLSPASVSQDANFWYVHVTYMHSQHHVTIGGSNTVPEFPSTPLLVILLLLSIVILSRVERKDHWFLSRRIWCKEVC